MDSSNGSTPTRAFPTAEQMHEWYMDGADRTMAQVAEHFRLSVATVKRRFEDHELACKPRGGSRARAVPQTGSGAPGFGGPLPEPEPTAPEEIQATVPETPIQGIAAAIVALERERDAAVVRGLRCEAAIDTLRELAA